MKKIKVLCSYVLEIEVPEDEEDGYDAEFDIEENHCPGTGRVGAALKERMEACDKSSTCWACPEGKNEIIWDSQYDEIQSDNTGR